MEMVETKLALAALLLAAAVSCQPRMTWEKVTLDGSRTGVTALTGDDVEAAFGAVEYSGDSIIWYAPNGRVFTGGSAPKTAASMIAFQPGLKHLKEVIGYCPAGMTRKGADGRPGVLGQWAADALLVAGESLYGKPMDVSIINNGGIRVDMPRGNVMLGDILAMFPFRNNIVCVELRGSDLEKLFGLVAEGGKFSFGGACIEVRDRKLASLSVGGRPLDRDAVYSLCTIDFLLEGGDGMSAAENALRIENRAMKIADWMVPYIKTGYAGGAELGQTDDGRFKVL